MLKVLRKEEGDVEWMEEEEVVVEREEGYIGNGRCCLLRVVTAKEGVQR